MVKIGIKDLFKRKKIKETRSINQTKTSIKLINDYDLYFTNFGGEIYQDATARACIDVIARHCAKLNITKQGSSTNFLDLITISPNRVQSSFDFIYKVVTNLFVRNNCFVEIVRRGNQVVELIPIDYTTVTISEDGAFIYFTFKDGSESIAEYKDVIHLRRHYDNSFFGNESYSVTDNSITALNSVSEGIVNATRNSAKLRGLLKFQNVLRREDRNKEKADFEQDYLNISNDGGIAVLDSKADFIPIASADFKIIDADQINELRKSLYIYFGVSEAILTGNYTEEQFNAFYSSVIEPIAIQWSLEFSRKIFTDKELSHNNRIVFSADRLTFANNQTKANMINLLLPLGVLSVNEARVILELNELEEDKRLMSLNYVNFDNADAYQMSKANGGDANGTTKTNTDS